MKCQNFLISIVVLLFIFPNSAYPQEVLKTLKNLVLLDIDQASGLNAGDEVYVSRKMKSELEKLSTKYPEDYLKIAINIKEPVFSGKPLDEKKEKLQKPDGNYLLKTDRDDLTDSEIWHLYVMLTRAEGAFRNLKTDLKMRPNFHQIEKRVEGHVLITILAYHLLHSIEQTLREKKCTGSWATIKRIVTSHTYSSIILPATDGRVIHLRKAGRAEPVHEEIYKKLQIDLDRLTT